MHVGERLVDDALVGPQLRQWPQQPMRRVRRTWLTDLRAAIDELWSSLSRTQRLLSVGLCAAAAAVLVISAQVSHLAERAIIASHEGGLQAAAREIEALLPQIDGRLVLAGDASASLDKVTEKLADHGTYVRLWTLSGELVYAHASASASASAGEPEPPAPALLDDVASEGSVVAIADGPPASGRVVELYVPITDGVTGRPIGVLESFEYLGHVDAGLRLAQRVLTASLVLGLVLLGGVAAVGIVSLSRWAAARRAEEKRTAQLATRGRIVADLHDSVASDLTRTLFAVRRSKLEASGDVALLGAMSAIEGMLESAEERLRDLMRDDRSTSASARPLAEAMPEACARFDAESGVATSVHVDPRAAGVTDPELIEDAARALEEALLNVRKHARATRADVSLTVDGRWLTLVVADDGTGVRPGLAPADGRPRLGLAGIRGRAIDRGGSLDVRRGPFGGTRFELRLPVA